MPFLAINALDDPIVAHLPTLETESSTTCCLAVTPKGGHLGWFTGGRFLTGLTSLLGGLPPDRWVRQPVLEFLKAAAEDVVSESKFANGFGGDDGRTVKGDDGFILEKGKESTVGFKVVQEGVIIKGEEDTTAEDLKAGL